MESAKPIQYSDMPHGSKQSDLSDYIVRLDKIYEEICDKQVELMEKQAEIAALIAKLPDGIESSILHKRYIEFEKWEQICVDINYEWRQTHKYHARALKHIEVPKEILEAIMNPKEDI